MAFIDFLYATTTWTLALVVSSIFVGFTIVALLLINRVWSKELRSSHNDITGFLISVVGVVFAILVSSLAITVMTRQDKADSLVKEEVQVLDAIYRETDVVAPNARDGLRRDVLAYLDSVIDGNWPQMRAGKLPTKSRPSWDKLWRDVAALPVTNFAELLTAQSLRQQLDKLAELRRGQAEIATTGVDAIVWTVVLIGSVSTILFAVLFGVRNFAAHMMMTCLVSFTISLTIIMIIALDWPYYGSGSVGPEGLEKLRQTLTQNAVPPT